MYLSYSLVYSDSDDLSIIYDHYTIFWKLKVSWRCRVTVSACVSQLNNKRDEKYIYFFNNPLPFLNWNRKKQVSIESCYYLMSPAICRCFCNCNNTFPCDSSIAINHFPTVKIRASFILCRRYYDVVDAQTVFRAK